MEDYGSDGSNEGVEEMDKYGSFRYRTKSETIYKETLAGRSGVFKYWDTDYVVYGFCGGAPGDGGKGGIGGRAGSINIFQLNANTSIVQTAAKGGEGEPGIGGASGTLPKVTNVHYAKYQHIGLGGNTKVTWTKKVGEVDTNCPELPASSNGTNVKDIEEPAPLSTYQQAFSINEYLAYIRENQIDSLRRDDLAKFVRQIQNSSAVLNSYTALSFINELQSVEDQFYRLKSKIDFTPYYRSMSDRIELYVSHANRSSEVKRVFTYLYTAAWGKYLTLSSAAQPNLVIKIEKYLGSAIATIQEVVKSTREDAISNITMAYHNETEQKVNEANAFIKTDILPTITNITKEIDKSMLAIVDEAAALRKKAIDDQKKYEKELKKLQGTMALRGLFHVLGVVGTFANCLGPYGQAAGAITGAISQIGEGFTDSSKSDGDVMAALPDGVKAAIDGINEATKKNREEEIKDLDEQIKEMADKVEKHPETLSDTLQFLKDYRALLEIENKRDPPNRSAVDEIKNKIKEHLAGKEKILNEKKDGLNEDGKKALEVMENVNKGFKVFSSFPEAYKKFKDDHDKLDEVIAHYNLY